MGRVAAIVGLLALALAVVVAFTAAAHKNSQITSLRTDGVPVRFTVAACLGLLGGSGSNAAGYSCHGSYRLDGQRFEEHLPGDTLRAPGSVVRAVAVPGDPALVTTAAALRTERASAKVFVFPGILAAALVLALALTATGLRRTRGRRLSPWRAQPTPASGNGARP